MVNFFIIFPVIFLIKLYQLIISPIIGKNCRFLPTCSEYTIDSLKNFGVIKGSLLSIKRILKCHPLGRNGYDPVPNNLKGKK